MYIENVNTKTIYFLRHFVIMKKRKKLYVLLTVLFFAAPLLGQGKKNSIKISGIAAHYVSKKRSIDSKYKELGYYSFPIDIGMGATYFRFVNNNIGLGTGFNYQRGRQSSNISGNQRFQFIEISIPLLLQKNISLTEKGSLVFTTGIYGGIMILQGVQSVGSSGTWYEIEYLDRIEGYSDDTHFLDIYFDVGYAFQIGKKREIACSPFLKYRANTTWFNTHIEKLHYGVKLIYTFNF